MKALIFISLLWPVSGFAQDTASVLMSTCEAVADDSGLSLYHDANNRNAGSLLIYNQGEHAAHIVDIQYTNAGGRAIVVGDGLPMLILMGPGPNEVNWNGKLWMCTNYF